MTYPVPDGERGNNSCGYRRAILAPRQRSAKARNECVRAVIHNNKVAKRIVVSVSVEVVNVLLSGKLPANSNLNDVAMFRLPVCRSVPLGYLDVPIAVPARSNITYVKPVSRLHECFARVRNVLACQLASAKSISYPPVLLGLASALRGPHPLYGFGTSLFAPSAQPPSPGKVWISGGTYSAPLGFRAALTATLWTFLLWAWHRAVSFYLVVWNYTPTGRIQQEGGAA